MKANKLPSVEELNELFRYEPETGKLYWRLRPCKNIKPGDEVGWVWSKTSKSGTIDGPYIRVGVHGKEYRAHRIIYKMIHGDFDESLVIDHIDGDSLNNRPDNLRAVTQSVNRRNSIKRRNNTSGITGVSWDKANQKWMVQVRLNNKGTTLGRYHDKEDAAKVVEEYRKANGFTDRHGK